LVKRIVLIIATETIGGLNQEEDFIVKKYFRGFDWNRITIDTRLFLNLEKELATG